MQQQIQDLTLSQQQQPSDSAARDSLIKEWVFRFQANCDKNLTSTQAGAIVALWAESFSDLSDTTLEAAFRRTICECKFWPKIADIREHIERAKDNSAQEQAQRAWKWVLDYIRLHYFPDLSVNRAPRIPERIRRAILRAGGLQHLSECSKKELVFAQKSFVESFLRWDELHQDQFLLPEGELTNLFGKLAESKSLPNSSEDETD